MIITFFDELEAGWKEYTNRKAQVSMGSFKGWATTPDIYAFERACGAAEFLKGKYNHIIEIARDGLWLGYILSHFGYDPKTVRMSREGLWQPMQELGRLEGKVLLCDLDVVSGGTIQRAHEKVTELGATQVDVLLHNTESALTVRRLKKMMKESQIQQIVQQEFPGAKNIKITKDGIIFGYWAGEKTLLDPNYLIIEAKKMMPARVKCYGLMDFRSGKVLKL